MKKIVCLALVLSSIAVGTVAATMEPAHAAAKVAPCSLENKMNGKC